MHARLLLVGASCAALLASGVAVALTGTWKASLALTGKSTYVGTVEFAAPRDSSVSGQLNLTAPVSVVAPLSGIMRGDSVQLAGDYQAGNGCTGKITAMLHVSDSSGVSLATGPATLTDKCVGPIPAQMRLSR